MKTKTITDKVKLCDMCGKPFTGLSFPIVNENYVVQEGLIQCGQCFTGNVKGDGKKIKR